MQTSLRITRSSSNIPYFQFKCNFFKNIFFPSAIIEWNHPDTSIILNSKRLSTFQKKYSPIYRPSPSSTYNCFSNKGMKHINRLRLGLSHLCNHKFKHGLLDSLNPICSVGLDTETTCHYLPLPQFHN